MLRNLVLLVPIFALPVAGLAGDSPTSQPVFVPEHMGQRTIVFVCDGSGALISNIEQVKKMLSEVVQEVRPVDLFDIVFYQDGNVLKLSDTPLPASVDNKQKAQDWLKNLVAAGASDPAAALTFALKLKPKLLYFLNDSADSLNAPAIQGLFQVLNADHTTRANTILLIDSKEQQEASKNAESAMKAIAQENGGVFKLVRIDELK